eukprot:Colp12_sorted_trinity150504_noHs@35882
MNFIRSLVQKFSVPSGYKEIGTDLVGNRFFEKQMPGGRPRRMVLTEEGLRSPTEFDHLTLATEWDRWLKNTRKDPPTAEEILQNIARQEQLAEAVRELKEKEEMERITHPSPVYIGETHASAPIYNKNLFVSEPTRTGDDFRPGSWIPGGDTSGESEKQEGQDKPDR